MKYSNRVFNYGKENERIEHGYKSIDGIWRGDITNAPGPNVDTLRSLLGRKIDSARFFDSADYKDGTSIPGAESFACLDDCVRLEGKNLMWTIPLEDILETEFQMKKGEINFMKIHYKSVNEVFDGMWTGGSDPEDDDYEPWDAFGLSNTLEIYFLRTK